MRIHTNDSRILRANSLTRITQSFAGHIEVPLRQQHHYNDSDCRESHSCESKEACKGNIGPCDVERMKLVTASRTDTRPGLHNQTCIVCPQQPCEHTHYARCTHRWGICRKATLNGPLVKHRCLHSQTNAHPPYHECGTCHAMTAESQALHDLLQIMEPER